jgi:hypothetical protein
MRHPLVFFLPFVIAAARSLKFRIRLPGESEGLPAISADTECKFLLILIFCLTGLLITLYLMTRFPDLGATIAEYNQI